jgi:hypothetical protein
MRRFHFCRLAARAPSVCLNMHRHLRPGIVRPFSHRRIIASERRRKIIRCTLRMIDVLNAFVDCVGMVSAFK